MWIRSVIVFLFLMVAQMESIMWYMEPGERKCLKEEVPAHVLLSGEYQVSDVPGQRIDFSVNVPSRVYFEKLRL